MTFFNNDCVLFVLYVPNYVIPFCIVLIYYINFALFLIKYLNQPYGYPSLSLHPMQNISIILAHKNYTKQKYLYLSWIQHVLVTNMTLYIIIVFYLFCVVIMLYCFGSFYGYQYIFTPPTKLQFGVPRSRCDLNSI